MENSRWKADLGVGNSHDVKRASQVALVVENPPASAGDTREAGWIPGREDPLEEGLATCSSVCLENPGTEKPGHCSPRGPREWDTTERLSTDTRRERCAGALYARAQTSVAFAALSPGPPQALLRTGPGCSCSRGDGPQPCPLIVTTGVRSPSSVTQAIWSTERF